MKATGNAIRAVINLVRIGGLLLAPQRPAALPGLANRGPWLVFDGQPWASSRLALLSESVSRRQSAPCLRLAVRNGDLRLDMQDAARLPRLGLQLTSQHMLGTA